MNAVHNAVSNAGWNLVKEAVVNKVVIDAVLIVVGNVVYEWNAKYSS